MKVEKTIEKLKKIAFWFIKIFFEETQIKRKPFTKITASIEGEVLD